MSGAGVSGNSGAQVCVTILQNRSSNIENRKKLCFCRSVDCHKGGKSSIILHYASFVPVGISFAWNSGKTSEKPLTWFNYCKIKLLILFIYRWFLITKKISLKPWQSWDLFVCLRGDIFCVFIKMQSWKIANNNHEKILFFCWKINIYVYFCKLI